MRSDYILYTVAAIFFIITLLAIASSIGSQQVWIVSTVVIGLAFIAAGYTQKPKTSATASSPIAFEQPTPPPPQQQPLVVATAPETAPLVTEPLKVEEVKPAVEEPQPVTSELMKVKGIGEKRMVQLKTLGINTLQDLRNASPKDLAAKLNISPKITSKWIEQTKENTQTS